MLEMDLLLVQVLSSGKSFKVDITLLRFFEIHYFGSREMLLTEQRRIISTLVSTFFRCFRKFSKKNKFA